MPFVSALEATNILKSNQVVGIPTETVYGLAGRIYSNSALKLIFSTKKRPFFDPLIVHVRDKIQARSLVESWAPIADALADHFWPGPLTLVLQKNQEVSDLISAGLPTVGLRCPNHPMALKILDYLGEPFAAPSANLFGHTSPTEAQHVIDEFKNQIAVVDGGTCAIGIESTVLSIHQDTLSILRPGAITLNQIEEVLNTVGLFHVWSKTVDKRLSPGQMKHHYMPAKPLFAVSTKIKDDLLDRLNRELKVLPDQVEGVTLIKPKKISTYSELQLSKDPTEAARNLYSQLRTLARGDSDALVFRIEDYHQEQAWSAIWERLSKASSAIIKD